MLPPLSKDEWVNDPITHLAKSGPALRSSANTALTALASLVPRNANGVPVEYDITYESPPNEIRGYKLTDLLTKCIWISPCNHDIALTHLTTVVEKGPTEKGLQILEQLARNAADKYQQRTYRHDIRQLVVLPGSNLLARGLVNMELVQQAVDAGAHVKPHPITHKLDLSLLKRKFGNRLLPEQGQLYPLIRQAECVYFCTSSEAGLMTGILGKPFKVIDARVQMLTPTYSTLYQAMDRARITCTLREKIATLLSHPESGWFTVYHDDVALSIDSFFKQFAGYQNRRT